MDNKTYKMGECVLAANEYANAKGGGFVFWVFRMCATPLGANLSFLNSIPAATFKEADQQGHKLNSHCFLVKGGLVFDPMFNKIGVPMDRYLIDICQYVEVSPDRPMVVFDLQILRECHRKENRSQFIEHDVIQYCFMVDTQKKTMVRSLA